MVVCQMLLALWLMVWPFVVIYVMKFILHLMLLPFDMFCHGCVSDVVGTVADGMTFCSYLCDEIHTTPHVIAI